MVSPKKLLTGMVQLYTGNGKGKTTAALGLALRAIGRGLSVYMVQFMKGDPEYGGLQAVRSLPNFIIRQYGRSEFVNRDNPAEEDIHLAQQGLAHAREVIGSGRYDVVILDEINVALEFKLIDLQDVLTLIQHKPRGTELVLTGRYAPAQIIDVADLVTEMREIKHYFQQGRKSRNGIDR